MMTWEWPDGVDLPGYKPNRKGHAKQIKEAARLMGEAQRPVIYAGGGILKARAAEALRALVDATGIPVVTTLMARGAFPDDHELCLGMPGMHGNYTAITSMQQSDLLIALGSRFDDRVTGKVSAFAPGAKIIHVDIDPAELGKVRRPDVPIVGDCRLVIEELVKAVKADQGKRDWPSLDAWHHQLKEWQERYPLHYEQFDDGPLKPQFVVEMLRDHTPDDTIVASGVGQHQMWTSQHWKFNYPYTFVNSGGLGTMGFAVPAAIGAKVGKPERMVWAVDGDGCFQMTAQELVTASAERIPVKIAILNNAYLGMVRQWQELFYEERYSEVYLSPDLPDYVKWAEAMGCVAFRVDNARRRRADDREGERGRRPARRDRLPHRLPGEGVPDGRGRHVERRRDPRSRPRHLRSPVAMAGATPHPQRARREQVRRAQPRRGTVRATRLQHRVARGEPDRGRAVQPHDDRRRRRLGAARADHEAAEQARPRAEDQPSTTRTRRWSASSCSITVKATPELRSQITELAVDLPGPHRRRRARRAHHPGGRRAAEARRDDRPAPALRDHGAPAHRPHRSARSSPVARRSSVR